MGNARSDAFAPLVRDYLERLNHYVRCELVELPSRRKRGGGGAGKSDEASEILERVSERDWLIALDERGQSLSSPELSAFLGRAQNQSRNLLFAIGGDEGLGSQVVEQSELSLSLSRMTFPHRLARLVLVEQLYRGLTLLKGEPYHK